MNSDPVLDFTALAGLNISGSISLAREANYDSVVGFYKIQNTNGAVIDPITGNLITPDADGYSTAALESSNLFTDFGTLSTENNTTKPFLFLLSLIQICSLLMQPYQIQVRHSFPLPLLIVMGLLISDLLVLR